MPYKNPEVKKAKDRERARSKRAELKLYKAKYYQENKEKCDQASANWAAKNRDKARQYVRNWTARNQHRKNAAEAKRRAAKLNATPSWADLDAIAELYVKCPVGMEVDHIVPLQGKNVSGLHVLENLQYLSKKVNRQKSNLFKEI